MNCNDGSQSSAAIPGTHVPTELIRGASRGVSSDETFGKKWFGKITKDCLDSFFDDFDDLENALVVKLSTFFFLRRFLSLSIAICQDCQRQWHVGNPFGSHL